MYACSEARVYLLMQRIAGTVRGGYQCCVQIFHTIKMMNIWWEVYGADEV
jgi:hypothetical protein